MFSRKRLRNPNFTNKGQLAPDNLYVFGDREILEQSDGTVNVVWRYKTYASEEKFQKGENFNGDSFTVTGLPDNPSLLNPNLYLTELMKQKGEDVIQGTKLKDFIEIS